MAAFEKGDPVAWHHEYASQHAAGSIIRADALPEGTPVGKVKAVANDEGTYFLVKFGPDDERVLTEDELVKVAAD